jgi:hypothetical protein
MKASAFSANNNSRSNAATSSARAGSAAFHPIPLFPNPVFSPSAAPAQMALDHYVAGRNILDYLMGPVSAALTKLPAAVRFQPLIDRYDALYAQFDALADKTVTSVADRLAIGQLITQVNTANTNPFVVSAAMQTHIFDGEAAAGNANDLTGFHSTARIAPADVQFQVPGVRNAAAPYNARVKVRVGGRMLPTAAGFKASSMFPDGWDEATVVRKIEEAFLAVPNGQDGEVDGIAFAKIGATTVYPRV